ncbi:MAG TPA: cytochrome c peroxidase [Polyangia bacterium]|nr:cytochrome c peroxidase [Polyangia bacterium]
MLVRRRRVAPVLGFVALLAGALDAAGCRQEGPFSDADMATLRTFALAAPPPDTSNGHADDIKAAQLGKLLYFDPRAAGPLGPDDVSGQTISLGTAGDTGKVACVSCHDPSNGGADPRAPLTTTSLGIAYTVRNAPTVINAAYSPLWQFWDGRADSLWSQALSPPEGANEEGSSRLAIAHLLADHYADLYAAAFGAALPDLSTLPAAGMPGDPAWGALSTDDQTTVNTIFANYGKAIEAYERRLVSTAFAPSAFDQFLAGDTAALSPQAIAGAQIFIGRGGCQECHRGPLFSDFEFHDIGVPQEGEHVLDPDDGRWSGIPTLMGSIFDRSGAFSDDRTATDTAGLVATDDDVGRFKTPSLRNVSKTAPYMHDGVYGDLWDVVNHYNFGGETGNYAGERDPAINPLLLSSDDLDNLIEFLESLEDGDALPTADFPEGLTTAPQLP